MESEVKKSMVSYRELLKIALPLIVTSASFTLLHFCDRMFLSHYSPVSLQAVVPAGILAFTLISFFMALAAISNSFVAQYYGAKEYENCSRSVAQGIFISILSAPLIWALIPLGLWILNLTGHSPEVLAEEKVYLWIMMLGGMNSPLTAAAGSFYSGRGKTRVIMMVHLIGNSCNILLNGLLIFGYGPFPEMGIRGAAVATLISGFVAPTILLSLYFSKKNNEVYKTRKLFRFDRAIFVRILRFGLPSGCHMVLDVGSFSLFVLLLGKLGDTALLASNIVLSINLIAFMPSVGIGQAASVMVGQCMGRNNPDEAESAVWKSSRIAWVYTLIVVTTFVALPETYIRFFAPNETVFTEVFDVARLLLLLAAGWGLLEATNAVLSGALRGAGDTHFVMWFHTVAAWGVFSVGEALIVLVFKLNVYVAWGWANLYFLILAVGWIWRIKSGRWKHIELIERASSDVEQSGGIPV